jgi:hypothetical protein
VTCVGIAFGRAALPWLVAAVVCGWLALRVWILRNRLAVREAGEAPPSAPGWLLALARTRASLLVFALGAAACVAAAVLVSR